MQNLIHFLKQPFPYFRKKWHIVVITALCVFIVLAIVQSFGIARIDFCMLLFINVGYTFIAALCSAVVVYSFPVFFKRFFDEKRWTKGKYFVFIFLVTLMIAVANTLYNYFLLYSGVYLTRAETPFSVYLFHYLKVTFPVGIIPATFGYFWLKNQGLHSDLHEKEEQNRKLMNRIRNESISDEKIITLSGNTKDALTLFPRELFYIESVGNYIQINYHINGNISQKVLRATLLQMEELLSEYPYLVRCHRAFIVNTQHIEMIKGLKLRLKTIEKEIPVSKSFKSALKKM